MRRMDTRDESVAPSAADLKAVIEAERTGLAFVLLAHRPRPQELRVLSPERERLTIGRRPDSDLPLSWDTEVSRAHALLELLGGQWTVLDDGLSRNGTFVNGSRVYGRQPLHDRDRLCCGETALVFREPAGSATTVRRPHARPARAVACRCRRRSARS